MATFPAIDEFNEDDFDPRKRYPSIKLKDILGEEKLAEILAEKSAVDEPEQPKPKERLTQSLTIDGLEFRLVGVLQHGGRAVVGQHPACWTFDGVYRNGEKIEGIKTFMLTSEYARRAWTVASTQSLEELHRTVAVSLENREKA